MKRPYRLSIRINGKRVYTQLYKRWKDLRSRTQGYATSSPHLYQGLEVGFASFAEFREYALSLPKGIRFRKGTSPDRKDPTKGYVPGNVRFIPMSKNWGRRRSWQHMEEPQYMNWRDICLQSKECMCDVCIPY